MTSRTRRVPAVTCDLSVSLDGYAAGPHPTRERPFGDVVGTGEALHAWMFDHASDHPEEIAGILVAGAYVMGRGMFSPDRGPWDLGWRGWTFEAVGVRQTPEVTHLVYRRRAD
ncbi:hypothetical protein UQW22_14010 [Isoptericola halotolerans]|uniref:hypothetical protein n=1 Tax=Isoptericola halotolerans TaxID=300560 RepID=UPI0038909E8D